jgi:NAD(P)-dependent dehydrogenase (short-subunit alcohol dehydrogenase family)
VNVSSIATVDPFPGFFAYAASKAALNLMTASAAKEGANVGIRAFAVAPGAVETPMLRASFDAKAVPPEACLEPESVARVIVACATGLRDADSGRVIPVVPEAARQWLHGWYDAHPPLRG